MDKEAISKQLESLKAIEKARGPLRWIRAGIERLQAAIIEGVIGPDTHEPEKQGEPLVVKPGEYGNCFDCHKPIKRLKDRKRFPHADGFVIVCLKCDDERWRKIHQG